MNPPDMRAACIGAVRMNVFSFLVGTFVAGRMLAAGRRLAITLGVAVVVSGLLPAQGRAGTRCENATISPQSAAAAAQTALTVAAALDERDAPAALVARVGNDLSAQGLVYSHVGFVVRDHPAGRWTAVHLLNECGSDRSNLYTQGLVNFFADDLVNQDARIVWLQPEQARRLADYLRALPRGALHQPHYNLIARPGGADYQNSTAWVVEILGASLLDSSDDHRLSRHRRDAYRAAESDGFRPDRIHIPYSKRVLGGLFSANVAFTDHPIGTRLAGDYPVVTVRSIIEYLDRSGHVDAQREWRNGQVTTRLGAL